MPLPCRSAICGETGPQLWPIGPSHSRALEAPNDKSGHFFELIWSWLAQAHFLNHKSVFGQHSAYELLCLLRLKIRPCSHCYAIWEPGQISGKTSAFITITKAQWKSPVNEETPIKKFPKGRRVIRTHYI